MSTRLLLLCFLLSGAVLLGACSGDDPAEPGGRSRVGLDFSDVAAGDFVTAVVGDFRVDHDADDPDNDGLTVAAHAGGQVIKDSDNDNALGATFTVAAESQRLFTYESLDAADLLGTAGTQPASGVNVRGYLADALLGFEYYGPPATDLRTYAAQALAGLELSRLEVEITSTGGDMGDDLAVGFLELDRTDTALLDFDILPQGLLTHLFAGEFELTWPGGTEEKLEIVDAGEGNHVLTDAVFEGSSPAVAVLERADGGVFRLDAVYVADLLNDEPPGNHNESAIVLEGYLAGVSAGADTFTPLGAAFTSVATTALAGVDLTSLQIRLTSVDGTYKSDDLAISGMLLSLVE